MEKAVESGGIGSKAFPVLGSKSMARRKYVVVHFFSTVQADVMIGGRDAERIH